MKICIMPNSATIAVLAAGVIALWSASASSAITIFSSTLSKIGEPVPTSSAKGAAIITFDDVQNTVAVQVAFAGIANSSAFGHIHCCTAVGGSGNAPVSLGFGALPSTTTGTYIDTFTLAGPAFSTLLNGFTAGTAYVNIHTPGTYASGEIRGFPASAISAPSATYSAVAPLSAVGEPVPTSNGTGGASLLFNDTLRTVTVQIAFAGIANTSAFGHIHCCTAVGGTGSSPVLVPFNALPNSTNGTYIDTITLSPEVYSTLTNGINSGRSYVNIHTPGTYSAGEIRGFLSGAAVAVPEPSTWAMMFVGFGLVGFMMRHRSTASLKAVRRHV
jgi:hypothetical protein